MSATPADARSGVKIDVNGNEVANGSAPTWQTGSNTVTVTVTAEDGSTADYTVTVTKS